MNATAKITRDLLTEKGGYAGRTFNWGDGWSVEQGGERATFSLWDDDRICYYTGVVWAEDEVSLELALTWLYDWGAYDSGTVALKVNNEVVYG